MGFLDNLESSLNNLERQEERSGNEAQRRIDDRKRTLAAAPYSEQLKTSDWTRRLFDEAALAGHKIRAKIYLAWIDTTLRLEAKGERLDLVPGPDGVIANYTKNGEHVSEGIDFESNPSELLQRWLEQGEQ